jgi:hypothetical protein
MIAASCLSQLGATLAGGSGASPGAASAAIAHVAQRSRVHTLLVEAVPLGQLVIAVGALLGEALLARGHGIADLPLFGQPLDALEERRGSNASAHVVHKDDAAVPLRQQHGCAQGYGLLDQGGGNVTVREVQGRVRQAGFA